jgi:heme-degrading monooxygenase HmoA
MISMYQPPLFQALIKKGSPVTVKIIIKRQGSGILSEQLTPFLLKLRNLAMNQPGYITGETLKSIDPPGQTLVISTWESKEAWQQWLANPERVAIQAQINVLIGDPTSYEIYSPG